MHTTRTAIATAPARNRRAERTYRARNLPHRMRPRALRAEMYKVLGLGILSELRARVLRADGSIEDLGVISRRLVTNSGVGYLVDALMNLVEPENLNFHASGTGTTAEAVGDSALVTEAATRVSGTQSKPASNQYRTIGTIPYTGALAITEHGIFSASTAGTLLDRSVFAVINVSNGDSIQFTYTFTLTAGG